MFRSFCPSLGRTKPSLRRMIRNEPIRREIIFTQCNSRVESDKEALKQSERRESGSSLACSRSGTHLCRVLLWMSRGCMSSTGVAFVSKHHVSKHLLWLRLFRYHTPFPPIRAGPTTLPNHLKNSELELVATYSSSHKSVK